MTNLRNLKVSIFAERDTVDDAINYASEIAGVHGTTGAMVTYNTLLETLAKREESKSAFDRALAVFSDLNPGDELPEVFTDNVGSSILLLLQNQGYIDTIETNGNFLFVKAPAARSKAFA